MGTAKEKDGKNEARGEPNGATLNLESELDGLFQLPLAEFTAARNALAARLKKAGRGDEAERVKALAKPPISAWAVNQLYWAHRAAFERLTAAGERSRRAQASQLADKAVDVSGALSARRAALSELSRLAGALLEDAGHHPGPDTMRRIATTLEALSIYSSLSDAPRPGRLTEDVDPPGFESLAALMPGVGRAARPGVPEAPARRVLPFQPAARKDAARHAGIASAKAALQAAEMAYREARTAALDIAASLKKATAHADEMEKNQAGAEERLKKASAAAEEARQLLHGLAAEAKKSAKVLEHAEQGLEAARRELLQLEK